MTRALNGYSSCEKWPVPHLQRTLVSWGKLQDLVRQGSVFINGHSLDIATLVALARYDCIPAIEKSETLVKRVEDSVQILKDYLSEGYFLYGVNTGFGGSADTRTQDLYGLQNALMQHTQSAVVTQISENSIGNDGSRPMPTSWTRASMLVRCNSNIRGHSAISLKVCDTIIELLRQKITPIVPLRGSVSASGDLMPLSYIAGAIQGNPDVFVRFSSSEAGEKVMSAQKALEQAQISPIVLGPKEGLSLINGTAPSAAVACLALHDTQQLAVLSQLLTALTSEALGANVEWAHSFIAEVRPHKGQVEAAQNIRTFLSGSKLTTGLETSKDRFMVGLAQERYALRSSPQWIGPQLEDLSLAESQLTVELNSTSDNPVVNTTENDIHCGANFQAAAVTSATEKTRSCLQMLGKMIFSQTSEMINHDLSNGLPPNLAADDPSLSFCLKGVDVNMAAYQSELAYLANPISSHVQSAEMHNQAINSLALLSSRYTYQAVEILSLMVAGCIYTGCQGADLRVMHQTFLEYFESRAQDILTTALSAHTVASPEQSLEIFANFWKEAKKTWYATSSLDAHERCEHATSTLALTLTGSGPQQQGPKQDQQTLLPSSRTPFHRILSPDLTLTQVSTLQSTLHTSMLKSYLAHREAFFHQPTTARYLGRGSRRLYEFVRHDLGVPMHRGLIEHPTPTTHLDANFSPGVLWEGSNNGGGSVMKDTPLLDGRPKRTIGSWVGIVYEAVRDGRVVDMIMRGVREEEERR